MFTSLRVTGFRAFKNLSVERLARVNLFVGSNNWGKTSLLEAVEVLAGRGGMRSVLAGPMRRQETMGRDGARVVVRHLFHGHRLTERASFAIEATDEWNRRVEVALLRSRNDPEKSTEHRLSLVSHTLGWGEAGGGFKVRLSADDAVPTAAQDDSPAPAEAPPLHFISTEGFDPHTRFLLWDEVVLSPEEPLVLEALRIIEPKLERIAVVDREMNTGGFVLRLQDSSERLPVGNMGGGLGRLLSLAICLVRSRGGFLLIDEIDTALHYSAMFEMWQFVIATARRHDVQVFATTHSLDCMYALGELYREDPSIQPDVLLHRINKDREQTTIYTANELPIIASDRIEVRG